MSPSAFQPIRTFVAANSPFGEPEEIARLADGPDGSYFSISTKKERLLVLQTAHDDQNLLRWEFESAKTLSGFDALFMPEPFMFGTLNERGYLIYRGADLNVAEAPSESLTRGLALLHRTKAPWSFGFNPPEKWSRTWGEFFIHQRLKPLAEKSRKFIKTSWIMQLLQEIDEFFVFFDASRIKPSLLHGNLRREYCLTNGQNSGFMAPRCIYGHDQFECDIAALKGLISLDAYLHLRGDRFLFGDELKLVYSLYHSLTEIVEGKQEAVESAEAQFEMILENRRQI